MATVPKEVREQAEGRMQGCEAGPAQHIAPQWGGLSMEVRPCSSRERERSRGKALGSILHASQGLWKFCQKREKP